MIVIDRNIETYVVSADASIRNALQCIQNNKHGFVFAIKGGGYLAGILTDGDFRRWIIEKKNPDLDSPVETIMNQEFTTKRFGTTIRKIDRLFGEVIRFVPLIDDRGRLMAIALPREESFQIEGRDIGKGYPIFMIAEIGNNHNGDFELAKTLVDEAISAGADSVKFQMRDLKTLYRTADSQKDAREDLSAQYTLDLLTRFQLEPEELFRIFDYCRDKRTIPLCTPWDERSLERLEEYGMSAYKAASADLTNHELLKAMMQTGKPLICSTGMSTDVEINDAVALLKDGGARYALLHCNSTYPAPFKDLNLAFIHSLREIGDCPVGYSSHDRGINIAIATASMGVNIIEKHFTLDKEMEGNDHRISLLPSEFSAMVEAIREVELAIGNANTGRHLSQGEVMNRENLSKSVIAECKIKAGEIIRENMLAIRSPGRGLPPYRKHELIGHQAVRDMNPSDFFFISDLGESKISARNFNFGRPFGIPVRYHDVKKLLKLSNFDLAEFHLSYMDMELDPADFIDGPMELDFVVHAPELFAGDHTMDLCSSDPDYRAESIRELGRVIETTRLIGKFFPNTERPRIIINAGGFTKDAMLPHTDRIGLYEMVLDALESIETGDVEIIAQTMPPFPWHFGGQRYHNLFTDADEIAEIWGSHEHRVCLDISHSKLACTHFNKSFSEFLKKVAPHTAHAHIADAEDIDGEGLQIGEGDIDFAAFGKAFAEFMPDVSFIPEIWQGHRNGGEGFWPALAHLEKYFAPDFAD
jgi:sialic acid synthase SpsE/sugar phosphate isomerase/epimerase